MFIYPIYISAIWDSIITCSDAEPAENTISLRKWQPKHSRYAQKRMVRDEYPDLGKFSLCLNEIVTLTRYCVGMACCRSVWP